MIALVFVFFYFFMIRPQKKQEKKDSEMRDALAVGDEVTTIGGIIGKVVSIKGETFVLETTRDKTKIRFLRGAIRSVDVKAADIAAAVIESKDAEATEAEAKDANETAEAVETVETVETVAEADAATEEKKDEN
ncbi:MAG: preprotein translocase subunit YajC [Clostridia bacterium]|nr:preprotein translocase subunit YajC [Clostridia bacterium]